MKNRYVLTCTLFFIWLLFFDDFNLIQQYQRSKELSVLQEKEAYFKGQTTSLKQKIDELESNPDEAERYAREQYKMRRENEDIYIFEKSSHEEH